MIRTEPIIAVENIRESSEWYQKLLHCKSNHGGNVFEILTDEYGEHILSLHKGYGTEMIRMALQRCFSDKQVTEVLIDPLESDHRAIQFYKKAGFHFVEKRSFGIDICDVYSIKRNDWIKKYHVKNHVLKP